MTADELGFAVARFLLPYLAKVGAEIDSTTSFYSTEAGTWPPRAKSRRHARDLIRRVPGHEKIGTGSATEWRVSVAAYRAHHVKTSEKTKKAPEGTLAPKTPTAEDIATKTLGTMQLRPTTKKALDQAIDRFLSGEPLR